MLMLMPMLMLMLMPMLMLMLILTLMLIADADVDADAVAGLMEVSLKLPGKMRQTSMRSRLVPIDVYIEGRGS